MLKTVATTAGLDGVLGKSTLQFQGSPEANKDPRSSSRFAPAHWLLRLIRYLHTARELN